MTLQGTKLTGGSYSSDLSFTDSATISSIVGSDYTDDWGTWSSTGGYNGFWFTAMETTYLIQVIVLSVTHTVLVAHLEDLGLVF